jgi:uncharacterized glyoxalase superfamily protein PhnB
MLKNRSVPPCAVIPVLLHADVGAAAHWLCKAFGFRVRLRIGDHRIQLNAGDGCLVVTEGRDAVIVESAHLVMVRVEDADGHCERALQNGAEILVVPTSHTFGERQYSAKDFAGHRWTFTQSVADVAPEE